MANQSYATGWRPPPDPERLNYPYFPGFKTTIRTHNPPPPFGRRDYGPGTRPGFPDDWLGSVTQREHILAYPPLETPPPAKPEVAHLTITKVFAIGGARGAQVVVCSIAKKAASGKEDTFTAVAKIFDPLYYPFADDLVGRPQDVASHADGDYSREAAAYEHLRKTGQAGSLAPEYYGSWTFTSSIRDQTGEVQQRQIRLILIEYLNGYSLKSLFTRNRSDPDAEVDAFHYSEDFRLDVLASLLDGEVRQVHSGLSQMAMRPEHVVIVPHSGNKLCPQQGPRPRVVLIDYTLAMVWEQTEDYGKNMLESESAVLPQNPMERYWTSSLMQLEGWVPEEWYSNPKPVQEWLVSRFGKETRSNYAPINKDLSEVDQLADYNNWAIFGGCSVV